MLSAREASAGLFGAYRLARLDAGGLRFFDASLEGFWRSFYAAAIVAPLYAVLVLIKFAIEVDPPDAVRYLSVSAISYVIAWVAFPFAMFYVCGLLDRQRHFTRYIVAYNWAAVLQNGVYLPMAIAERIGLLAPAPAQFLILLVLLAVLAYSWFVARVALDVPVLTAVGIVVLDLMLGIFVQSWTDFLLQ